jgi:hypothetical protein
MDEFWITSSNPNHLLTQNSRERERESKLFKKYPGDMVENLARESVDVLGRSGECNKRNPQGGGPFLRESKREIER